VPGHCNASQDAQDATPTDQTQGPFLLMDESYVETRKLQSQRARRVLRRAGEAYQWQNINRKFAPRTTVMFWGAICYGKSGMYKFNYYYYYYYFITFFSVLIYNVYKANNINYYNEGHELPYHRYTTSHEMANQQREVLITLRREYKFELAQNQYATTLGLEVPFLNTLLKTRKEDRRGGIDLFIYRKRTLNPLLYLFTTLLATEFLQWNIKIMEDNTPAHSHYYHDIPCAPLGFTKLVWPASLGDLNPIQTSWTELKDTLHEQIGPRIVFIMGPHF